MLSIANECQIQPIHLYSGQQVAWTPKIKQKLHTIYRVLPGISHPCATQRSAASV